VIRVAVVSPEPTPYRAPLFDRLAREPDIDLTVLYAAHTVAARQWSVELEHPALFLRGIQLPTSRVLKHDYPITPSVIPVLARVRPDCVVVAGWSVFASQIAIAWARMHRVPYVVMSESHLLDRRPPWIRALKRAMIPRVVESASGFLVPGSLARDALVDYGADPARIRIFANTVDVENYGAHVEALRRTTDDIRARFGIQPGEVALLSVARLHGIKGLDVLIRAAAAVDGAHVVLAGAGPDEAALRTLACDLGTPVTFAGFLEGDRLTAAYAAADVFGLLSRSEPWGVAVVEAAAASLPLVLSSRVGAARDLLRPFENGFLVPPEDVCATVAALRELVADAGLRARYGARSSELASGWGYEASVHAFRATVVEAVERGRH